MRRLRLKLLSRFLWYLEKKIGIWKYQWDNIDTRPIPEPEKLLDAYSNTILSLYDINLEKNKEECKTRLALICVWAFRGHGINFPKTQTLILLLKEAKKYINIQEITLGRLSSPEYKTPIQIHGVDDLELLGLIDLASILVYKTCSEEGRGS